MRDRRGEEWKATEAQTEQAGTKCSASAGTAPTIDLGHGKMKHTQQVYRLSGGFTLT